jgi:hypothetical protein
MKKALLGGPKAQQLLEDAEQLQKELLDRSEWADGRWLRDLVVDIAYRGISEIEPGSEEGRDLTEFRADFLAAFAVITANSKITRATRSAVWEAILDALLIGCTIGSRELWATLQKKFERTRMATARKALAAKSAPKRDVKLAAVRAAIEATVTKPTRGEAYARLIEPQVNKRLGLEDDDKLSIWTIRDAVRAVLTEAPRKLGKP